MAAPLPEIQVLDGATAISPGSSSVNFGFTPEGMPFSKTFTVREPGDCQFDVEHGDQRAQRVLGHFRLRRNDGGRGLDFVHRQHERGGGGQL